MEDYDRNRDRQRGPRNYGSRKRGREEDDTYDRRERPQYRRRRDDGPPPGSRLKKQLLTIAESGMRNPEEEAQSIADIATQYYDDEYVRDTFCDISLSLVIEQPCKIVFVAAAALYVNNEKPELVQELLLKTRDLIQRYVDVGDWRRFKLLLRYLACLQGIFEDDGVFLVLEELFQRTIDLQTASPEDAVGLELVKIILLTIPYAMASSATGLEQRVQELLEKTDIVASTPHTLDSLVDPYPSDDPDRKAMECPNVLSILQKQLQNEATNGWPLLCIPRVFQPDSRLEDDEDAVPNSASKHKFSFPSFVIHEKVNPGPKAMFPELYFSLFADQDIESVPPTSDIASCLMRDSIVDTVDLLDFQRNFAAKYLIELDCYWAPGTFVKRATMFEKLKDVPEGKSTWKPEDVVVDAVFSKMMQLPKTENKLVYYHSLVTEACKLAPAAIAPSLGRAIRFMFRNAQTMDLELVYRYMDWFAHHLSNFDFRWKWTEWIDEVNNSDLHPRKAFILGALDREIRLAFAKRVLVTIPEPWHNLISEGQLKDQPDFKYANEEEPYAQQGQELHQIIRARNISDDDVERILSEVASLATEHNTDPAIASAHVFMTCICHAGSKSLSHVLSYIDKCKERLSAVGSASEPARREIITAVVTYWHFQPGIAVNLINKLLNFTVLTPMSVIEWALQDKLDRGRALSQPLIYDLVAITMTKVTNRVRQIVHARNDPSIDLHQKASVENTLVFERQNMRDFFATIEDSVRPVAEGGQDGMIEAFDSETTEFELLKSWGERWIRAWRRRAAVEEAVVGEAAVQAAEEVRDMTETYSKETQRRIDEAKREVDKEKAFDAFLQTGDPERLDKYDRLDGVTNGGLHGNGNGNGNGELGSSGAVQMMTIDDGDVA